MTHGDPQFETLPETQRVTVERAAPVHEHVVEQPVIREVAEPVVPATSSVDTIRRLVWLVFGVLQALIVLRFVLLLFGANEGNDVVAFVIAVTNPFVEPFRGMFDLDEVSGASGSVLDVAALIALVAWTLVEALILGIVGLADRRATTA